MAQPSLPGTAPGDAVTGPVAVAHVAAAHAAPVPPGPARAAAFFDLDNTIIRGASAFHLAVGLRRRGIVGTRDLIRFAIHQARYLARGENLADIDKVRSRALSIVGGRSVAEIAAIGEEVWDEVLSLRIFAGTQSLLNRHLEAGHQVWIITASPREIGELIGRRLGVTGALGTVAEHVDGVYTGRLVGELLHGPAKGEAVKALAAREGLDLARCSAYSDSYNDLPMLALVGDPCAINPDARLRNHARRAGWRIRDYRTGRKAARTGLVLGAAAGAVSGAVAAGVALRRRR